MSDFYWKFELCHTLNIGSGDRLANGTACLTANWESNCLSWPIELALAFSGVGFKIINFRLL